jgi:hypothetical protein
MRHIALLLVTTCLLISGCSDDKQSYAEMSDDNVFKGQVDALEKAKSVESTIQSSFDQRMQEK